MTRKSCIQLALAAAVGSLLWTATPQASAADEPAATSPYTLPLDKVTYLKGYPVITPEIQAAAAARMREWSRLNEEAWQRALPEVERWAKMGRPYLKVARQPSDLLAADIPAFPGAEGGAMYTYGGRGGKVFVVTSLADDGPGTLREACEAGGPRIVVFNVAGIIHLERPLEIEAPYISIEGQTAPGDGVCVAGRTTDIHTHDVVIRYMRFRRGITELADRDDALGGDAIGNVLLDHCSASWGLDETLSIYRQMYSPTPGAPRQKLPVVNVTIQWTLITEALDTYHHAFGATWGGLNTAFHHNLFADNTGRNASIGSENDFNWVNNVVFNWRHRTLDGGGLRSVVNVINNYYKPGPVTQQDELQYRVAKPEHGGGHYFVSGNFVVGNEKVTKDNWDGGVQYGPDAGTTTAPAESREEFLKRIRLDAPAPMPHITIQSAEDAYKSVLETVGANLPRRDPVDLRAVRQVRTGEVDYKAGKGIITDIQQVGGYPQYKGEPVKYTQNDGIPDWWKEKYGLDIHDPNLATKDTDGDGYTTIEEYLNGTDPTKKVDYKDLKNNVNPLAGADASKLLRDR